MKTQLQVSRHYVGVLARSNLPHGAEIASWQCAAYARLHHTCLVGDARERNTVQVSVYKPIDLSMRVLCAGSDPRADGSAMTI